jgi:hypothetical protein
MLGESTSQISIPCGVPVPILSGKLPDKRGHQTPTLRTAETGKG